VKQISPKIQRNLRLSDVTVVGCPECDLIGEIRTLESGQRAVCARCGCVLSVCFKDPYARAWSFSVAALVVLAIAFAFPFLSISASGVTNSMTLAQTVLYLAQYGAHGIAILVSIFVILVPLFMLAFIVVLATFLRADRFHPLLLAPTRWLFHLNGWAMVEVFAIGVIVSLVKLAAMAKVSLGPSFWAYLAFTGLFLMAFASMDRLSVWRDIERIRGRSRS
jgi:paraquat-inducible protein A